MTEKSFAEQYQTDIKKQAEASSPFGAALGAAREIGRQAEAAKSAETIALLDYDTAKRELKESGATPLLETLCKKAIDKMDKSTSTWMTRVRTWATERVDKAKKQKAALEPIYAARKDRGGDRSGDKAIMDLAKQEGKHLLVLKLPEGIHPIEWTQEKYNLWRSEMNDAAATRYDRAANKLERLNKGIKTLSKNIWGEKGLLTKLRASDVSESQKLKDATSEAYDTAKDNVKVTETGTKASAESSFMQDASVKADELHENGDADMSKNIDFQTEISGRAAGTKSTT